MSDNFTSYRNYKIMEALKNSIRHEIFKYAFKEPSFEETQKMVNNIDSLVKESECLFDEYDNFHFSTFYKNNNPKSAIDFTYTIMSNYSLPMRTTPNDLLEETVFRNKFKLVFKYEI